MLITDQHLKWAVAPSSKEKQQLNAARSLPFPQLSTVSLLLSFNYNSLFTILLRLDGICITAFGINCTDAIDSSWIHKNHKLSLSPTGYFFFLFLQTEKKYNSMHDSKEVLIWTAALLWTWFSSTSLEDEIPVLQRAAEGSDTG